MDKNIFDKDEIIEKYLGEKEIVIDVLKVFTAKVENQLKIIMNAIDSNEFDKIKFEAHSIKGSAYNITAKNLGDIAFSMEKAAKDFDIDKIKSDYELMKENFNKLKEILSSTIF